MPMRTFNQRVRPRTLSGWLCVAWAVMSLIAAECVQAQPARLPGNMEESFAPDFLRRDMAMIEQELQLDDDQKLIISTVFQDYEEAFKTGVDAVRADLGKSQPRAEEDPALEEKRVALRDQIRQLSDEWERSKGTDPDARKKLREKSEALQKELRSLQGPGPGADEIKQMYAAAASRLASWQAQKAQLRAKFVDDVQTTLSQQQQQTWPAIDRRMYRERTLPQGRLSGESVDLVQIFHEAAPESAAQQAAAPALQDHEINLDAALRRRNEYLASSDQDLLAASEAGDQAKATSIISKQVELRLAVRDVIDQSAAAIAALLPPEQGARFTRQAREKGYSRVYRPTQAQRLINAAKEISDLEAGVLQAVNELDQAYQGELTPANEQLVQVIRTAEPKGMIDRVARQFTPKSDQAADQAAKDEEDPIQRGFRVRSEMGQRYIQQLQGLLTPEQWAKLPKNNGRDQEGDRAKRNDRPDLPLPPGQEAILKMFDSNGDGVLDATEREALREHVRSGQRPGTSGADADKPSEQGHP